VRRTQIHIDEDLHRSLQAVAAAEGRSVAAVIREAIRSYLMGHHAGDADPILAAIGSVEGLPPDAAAEHDRDLYGTPRRRR
jgi:plasmid stability protein